MSINPYTSKGVFGVSYNGGYKPDPSLQWIPPGTSMDDDDGSDANFVPPPTLPPSNILLNTCEGKRIDIRKGGIPPRIIEYEDMTESQPIPGEIPISFDSDADAVVMSDKDPWNMLAMIALLLMVILFVVKFS